MSGKESLTHRQLSTSLGTIAYLLRKSSRRRTLEIAITSTAEARVSAPDRISIEHIERFIHSRAEWIIRKIAEQKQAVMLTAGKKYDSGHEFLYLGKPYPLVVDRTANASVKIIFGGETFHVRANAQTAESTIKSKLISWYRREAGEIFGSRVFHFSRLMDMTPLKITVKTQKSLWGSCNPRGRSINLNWVLIMAPLEVIDYVVVHELSHLYVPNHSRKFWKKVSSVLPDYELREEWLKQNAALMKLP